MRSPHRSTLPFRWDATHKSDRRRQSEAKPGRAGRRRPTLPAMLTAVVDRTWRAPGLTVWGTPTEHLRTTYRNAARRGTSAPAGRPLSVVHPGQPLRSLRRLDRGAANGDLGPAGDDLPNQPGHVTHRPPSTLIRMREKNDDRR